MESCIYEGHVRHRRFAPKQHEFRMPLFLMYLDLNELSTVFRRRWFWGVESFRPACFRRRDHFGDPKAPLDQSVRNLVEAETGRRPAGPVRMLAHLAYFGYCFNPLSIFFCFAADGRTLETVVAEVTNTPWKEKHCYVLPVTKSDRSTATVGEAGDLRSVVSAGSGDPFRTESGQTKHEFRFRKTFHVSPFMEMSFDYLWQLVEPGSRLVLQTENWPTDGCNPASPLFDATLTLTRREITGWSLAWSLLRYPALTAQVIAAIHWHALRLWWKQVPYVPHPGRSASGAGRD